MATLKKSPGRPKKSPADRRPKNGIRANHYSLVFHDIVKPDAKNILRDYVKITYKPDWFLIGKEDYNHQAGCHIHLFLEYKGVQQAYSTLKREYEKLELGGKVVITWGKGSHDQCHKYLMGHTKDKFIDGELYNTISKDEYKKKLNEYYTNPSSSWSHDDIPEELLNYGKQFSVKISREDINPYISKVKVKTLNEIFPIFKFLQEE